ncbi:MAG TPA: nucleotidyltransferase domain-containing protein, partial [Candidatus Micrarchaeota archaeon]|nr:nucleotidyltransferase domain-containing protein [Candidatus Micrarchaeota archaeon]
LTPFFKHLKVSHTLGLIESRGIIDSISLNSGGLSSILLYGSGARGEDDGSSDFDFLVIASRCDAKSSDLSAKLGRERSVQSYSISEWKELSRKNRAFYLEVITSSIALKGDKPVID